MLFSFQRFSPFYFLQSLIVITLCRALLFLIAFLMGCFFVSSAYAIDNYNTGAYYFANGDYVSAISVWSPLAQQGHPAAQYSMGLLYDQGKGVEKDSQRALQYFQSAVKQNLPAAQYYLGVKYYAGLGVDKNVKKARQLLTQAAQQDHLQAQFQLGLLYDNGEAGIQDPQLATDWFSKAAENGYGPAQHSLASHYITGRGVTLNLEKGGFWLQKAAEQNDADAMRDLGFLYFKGMGVKQDFKQAHDLLIFPADAGSALAQLLLGEIYATGGHGMTQNLARAKKWYLMAQRSGNKEAGQRLQAISRKKPDNKKIAGGIKPVTNLTRINAANGTRLELDASRFKQLDGKLFILQIVQARRYESISQLTEQYSDDHTYFFKITKENETLYVLLYGPYENYSDAKNIANALPEAFQLKSKPWIRQVKAIKPLIP